MKRLSLPALGFERPAPLFTARTLTGMVTGALASIVVCLSVGLLCAQLGLYGRAITVVWTLEAPKAAWNGAVLGLLVGWLAPTRQHLLRVGVLGLFLVWLLDWREQRASFMLYRNLFDVSVMVHYLFFTLIVCTIVFLVLRHNSSRHRAQRLD